LKKFREYGVDVGFVAKFHTRIDGVYGHGKDNENDIE
tara:strand:- start:4011 stop:4121 length:111 start_codon:yes stop_codon:yes gene_type:complete